MSQVIRIPEDVFSRLEELAQGFDTPANVIQRLLDNYEGLTQNKVMDKKTEEKNMLVKINEILNDFKENYQLSLSKLENKKIIFTGTTIDNRSVVTIMPSSKIYPKGNGWVDFTEIQVEKLKQYQVAIAIFRLADGSLYYVDFEDIFKILTEDNILENEREGRHWKIDIWPNELVVRNGGKSLDISANKENILKNIL